MQFIEELTIDWYDNILKSFCRDINNITYYCCVLALNSKTNEKIYLCIDVKYLKGCNVLKEIIDQNSFKENWDRLSDLIVVKKKNETFLIKAKNLRVDQIHLIKYKDNCKWSKKIIWGEYPIVLEKAAKIDNWWSYFPPS